MAVRHGPLRRPSRHYRTPIRQDARSRWARSVRRSTHGRRSDNLRIRWWRTTMTDVHRDHEHPEDAAGGTEDVAPGVRDQRIRLVVKGDDMGAGHGVNDATIDAHRRGILTTTNVIVPGAWFPEAVRLINENPTLDVGIHLALTSEWTNVKWRPLTSVPGLVDVDGYLPPAVHPRAGYPAGASLEESDWTLEQIEQELRAQLDLGLRHLPQATYTWCHMLFPTIDPSVTSLVASLTAEYGLIEPE